MLSPLQTVPRAARPGARQLLALARTSPSSSSLWSRTAPSLLSSLSPLLSSTPSCLLRHARPTSSAAAATAFNRFLKHPHPTPAPDDIFYFTSNSNFYHLLKNLNDAIRQNGLNIKDATPYASMKAKGQLPKWRSIDEMRTAQKMGLNETMYADLIHRLNILASIPQPSEAVRQLMHSCLKPGNLSTSADYQTEDAVLLAEEAALGFSRTLDADGRACTTASKKQARARVWTVRGEGHVFINGKPMIDYFAHAQERHVLADVFEVARAFGRYNVWAVVEGSGASSQAAALAVAIARGLCIHQPELTEALKAHHMTTIDVRQVERKKLGRPKARKGHTWVKR